MNIHVENTLIYILHLHWIKVKYLFWSKNVFVDISFSKPKKVELYIFLRSFALNVKICVAAFVVYLAFHWYSRWSYFDNQFRVHLVMCMLKMIVLYVATKTCDLKGKVCLLYLQRWGLWVRESGIWLNLNVNKFRISKFEELQRGKRSLNVLSFFADVILNCKLFSVSGIHQPRAWKKHSTLLIVK